MIPISIIILTANEEKNIKYALDTIKWAKEVFVVDSLSTDKTVAIAKKYPNVKVFSHKFENFSKQRNWAFDNLSFSTKWVFVLDADEMLTPQLMREVVKVIAQPQNVVNAYWCGRRFIFLGRWLRHGDWYPGWTLRLMRLGKARYEDRGANEYANVQGETDYLKNDLIHHDRKDLTDWIAKHNHYSSFEARELFFKKKDNFQGKFFGDRMERRRFFKNIAYHLPWRPWLRFFYMYFLKHGFLDGYQGFIFAVLQAVQEFYINIKLKELRLKYKFDNKDQVRHYWDRQPCGVKKCPYRAGTRDFFTFTKNRRERLEPFIKNCAQFKRWSGKRVLEIGCGIGVDTAEFIKAGANVSAIDISANSVELTEQRLADSGLKAEIQVMDAENLSFGSRQFDFVYSWGVLHHISCIEKAIKEIWRVLKPGSRFCVMVYHKNSIFALKAYLFYGLGRLKPWRSREEIFAQFVESAGTKIYTAKHIGCLFNRFRQIRIDYYLTPYDLSLIGNVYLPSWLFRQRYGFFMVINGIK